MNILVVHNRYQTPGGEDVVVDQEVALLRAHGVAVDTFFVDNDAITTTAEKISTALQVTYSSAMRRRLAGVLARSRPDVMHVHNFFPLLSPSIYDAAAAAGCPVVQTVHNYRLVCPRGTLFRDGKVCLDCVDRAIPWPAIQHRCYRESVAGSASVALMLAANRLRGAWTRRVDRFLLLTPFARDFFLAHTSIPAARMIVKPNAAEDPGMGPGDGGYALYVGRLSPEKGIATLLEAARLGLQVPLRVAGQGPMAPQVQQAHDDGILHFLGPQRPAQIRTLMHHASFLVLPSLWYEGLPMVVAEAFGAGLPILASRIGSLASLVDHEITGLQCTPGSAAEFAASARRLAGDQPSLARMRLQARAQYLASYQPDANLQLLLHTYQSVLRHTPASS